MNDFIAPPRTKKYDYEIVENQPREDFTLPIELENGLLDNSDLLRGHVWRRFRKLQSPQSDYYRRHNQKIIDKEPAKYGKQH